MSKINEHNYEEFYLDYLEGNLSAEDTAQLFLFLENNPVLKSELEDFELIRLNANPNVKFDKETLHKSINKSNVDNYIIASIENVIEKEDALELTDYLNNSEEVMALAKRYEKTILSKQKILFPEKNKLKKKSAATYYITPLLTAAAAALILLLVNSLSTEKLNFPIESQQLGNNATDTSIFELPAKESVFVAEEIDNRKNITPKLNNRKETVSKLDTAYKNKVKSTEQDLLVVSESKTTEESDFVIDTKTGDSVETVNSEEIIAAEENQELNELKISEPETINSGENKEFQGIALTNTLEITTELAKNTTNAVSETPPQLNIKSTKNRRINLWRIAKLGLKGFNKLNEKAFVAKANYSSSGELESVTIITDKGKITTPAI